MTLFFRAAACASVLASTVAVMASGTPTVAAMIAPEALDAPQTTPTADLLTDATNTVVVFTSTPVVQPVPASEPVLESDLITDEPDSYATLRQAVDAYDDEDGLDAEARCLAIAVFYESKGEPLKGQMAVAHVVLNRVESSRFPNSICGVVTQRSQFSFVRGGKLPSARPGAQWDTAKSVALAAIADAWDSPVGEALFFHATRVSPRWGKAKVASVGNHIFYR